MEISDFSLTGTNLDKLLDAVLLDTGLNSADNQNLTRSQVIDGAFYASQLNTMLHEAMLATGVLDDGAITSDDIYSINTYIRSDAERLAAWEAAHGSDSPNDTNPSGWATIHEEGSEDAFNRFNIVNRVMDSIYHIGFDITADGQVTNELGFAEYSVDLVAEFLNDILFGTPITVGTDGDDTFVATEAAEIFWGGTGYDIVDYSTASAGIYLDATRQGVEGAPSEGSTAIGDQIEGIDEIILSEYDDLVGGSPQAETIRGGGGNDIINGYWGDDIIYGGDGDDNLRGDLGNDEIYGEGGNDTIIGFIDGNIIDGGEGIDTLIYTPWMEQTLYVDLEAGFTQGGLGAACHDTLFSIENVTADNESENTLLGSSVRNIIAGGSVADIIDGRGGDDLLKGNEGNDTITGGEGNDILEGYTDDDRLIGGEGDDRLHGGDGTDVAVFSGTREDYDISEIPNGFRIIDLRNGSPDGTDEVLFVENFEFAGGVVIAATDLVQNVAETDLIEITGSDTANLIYASAEAEFISGLGGNDNLFGNGGDDVVNGGAGDDYVRGGIGSNIINGDDGNDYLFSFADGDIIDGGNGVDWLRFEGDTGAITLNLQTGILEAENVAGGTVANVERVTATSNNDSITGGSSNELIYGGYGDDSVSGGGGADILRGDQGNDTLSGDAGNDRLEGFIGDDILSGGDGVDYLHGGAGDDTFVFQRENYTLDIIRDFSAGAGTEDVVRVANDLAADFDELMTFASQSGSRTIIEFDASNRLFLDNTNVNDLHADDFEFVDPALIA